jgi:hypothetical protein
LNVDTGVGVHVIFISVEVGNSNHPLLKHARRGGLDFNPVVQIRWWLSGAK